ECEHARSRAKRRRAHGEAVGEIRNQSVWHLAPGLSIVRARSGQLRRDLCGLSKVASRGLGRLLRTAALLVARSPRTIVYRVDGLVAVPEQREQAVVDRQLHVACSRR